MSRILVTGASGFVGRAVIAALAKDGHAVRAAVRRSMPAFPGNIELVQHGDLAEPVDWSPVLAGIDVIIHLAGIAHIGPSVGASLYDRVNHLATAQLAKAAARAGVSRFIFISSIRAQSGPAADHALTERDSPAPTDAYGRSKLAAEQAIWNAGLSFTILRPVLIYGAGVKGNLAMLARAAATPLPLPVKNFVNRRSLLGIDNLISALTFVLSSPDTVGETYVLADPGMALKLGDIITTIRRANGRRPFLVPMSTDYLEWPLRALGRNDVWDRIGGNLRVDPAKLIAAGWQPLHDTRAGITAMVQAAAPRKSGTASVSTQ